MYFSIGIKKESVLVSEFWAGLSLQDSLYVESVQQVSADLQAC
jgi:hypothetical protein